MMAFAVGNGGGFRSDTKYVKWMVRFVESIDGVESYIQKFLQPCTDDDMARFDPPKDPHRIE